MRKWLSDTLMHLSPHDQKKLNHNTGELRRRIEEREYERDHAAAKSRDYIDTQLQIMRRN